MRLATAARQSKLKATVLGAIALPMMFACALAGAADFPSKPITMIVAYPAGGGSDMIARFLSEPLSKILGQPVIVENVAGSTGAIGAAKLARSEPDGYTIMLGSVNENILSPITKPDVSKQYTADDFTPIAKVGSSGFVIVGRKDFPASTIDEVIDLARGKPGTLSFGSTGVGSLQQIVMESLLQSTGTSMLHVPYRGGAPMLADLMGGQIDFAVSMPNIMVQQVRQKTIKAFAVTGSARDSSLPDVPSFRESREATGIDYVFWFGVFGPKGIPQDRVDRLKDATVKALADPKVIQQLRGIGVISPPADEQTQFPDFVRSQNGKLQAAVANMKLD